MNNNFEITLSRCYSLATKIIISKRTDCLHYMDITHDAYILLCDFKEEFTIQNMRRRIYDVVRGVTENNFSSATKLKLGIDGQKYKDWRLKDVEHKNCKCCSIVLPISFFYKLKQNKEGAITYSTLCKECTSKKALANKATRFSDPDKYCAYLEKEKERYANKKLVIKNNDKLCAYFKEKRNSYSRKSYQKHKPQLVIK